MLVDLKRMVAYICPVCSNISSKYISVFNFSGSGKLRLKCPTNGCHEECVTIAKKNTKYQLSIECPLCGGTHSYTAAQDSFWHRKLITYKCPAAGMDIFFAGEHNEVEKTLEDSSDIYSDVIDEYDLDDEASFNVLFAVIEQLHKLRDNNCISCVCGGEGTVFNVVDGSVMLTCQRCGRSKLFEASEDILARLLNSRRIIIGK